MPAQVSPECKDLLVRLLVADPERRMSMEEIKSHTWFSHALPAGALNMNDWYMSHPSGIDEVRPLEHALSTAWASLAQVAFTVSIDSGIRACGDGVLHARQRL